jgi:hypothetical protein
VAAHLPWVVCINGGVVAEGPPEHVFTSETLSRTYRAEMKVIIYDGLTMVAELPLRYGRSDKRDDEFAALHASERHRHA